MADSRSVWGKAVRELGGGAAGVVWPGVWGIKLHISRFRVR